MNQTKILGLLLVIVYIVALKLLAALDIGSVFEHRLLLPLLNTLFAGILPIVVAYVASKAYAKGGSVTALFMGCGMLSFGLCAISAGWLIRASDGANLNVTVYNVGAFCGSLFHAIGVMLSFVGTTYVDDIRQRRVRVILSYVGVTVFVACFSLVALRGLTPPFFVQGVGPTDLRQAVLASSVLLYAVSALFLMVNYVKRKSNFPYWYSLCLTMIAIGLFAFFVQKSVGSPIGWLGRSANYVGGIFALAAILGALRDAKTTGVSLEESVAAFLRNAAVSYKGSFLAVLPIPTFLVLLVIIASLDHRTVIEPPGLFASLNTLFLTIFPLSVVYFATRGYLQSGLFTMVTLGAGALVIGVGSLLSGWMMTLQESGPNAAATVLNLSFLLSAIFHFFGGVSAVIGKHPKNETPYKFQLLVFIYMGTALLTVMLALAILKGLVPPFFVKGEGPTALRQIVVGTAAILFGISGLLLLVVYLFSRARLLYWYSLALFLITTALVCYVCTKFPGDPIAWLGRGASYFSGIYLLVAVISAPRDLYVRGESQQTGIVNLFRHHLESLVEERTSQLTRATGELQAAHRELERANAELEARVLARTAELGFANEKLLVEIENRKSAEQLVSAERQRLYDILETMPIMVCLLTPDYHVAFSNRTFRQKFGESNGRHCYDHCFGFKEPCKFCEAYRVLETGKPHHWEVNAPDGSIIAAYDFPFADTDGSPLILEVDIDITEERRAQRELRESEERFRGIVEQGQLGVELVGLDGRFLMVNPKHSQLLEYSEDDLAAKTYAEITHPDDIESENELVQRLLSGEIPYLVMDKRYITKTGAVTWGNLTKSIIRSADGSPSYFLSMIQDINERKAMEQHLMRQTDELARSNQDLQQFAYVASHDLQEPLRNVASCLQMLEKKYKNNLDADADKLIHYAVESSVRMKALILDLLAYSRIGTRGDPLKPVDCEQILGQVVRNLASSISETGATISHDPLPIIPADGTQLLQVFQNLIGNALKFRRDNLPFIHVSAVKDTNEWTFSVEDNGIGIESRHLDRIFVIFQRLHKRSQYDGTGMGLAIVKKVIERHSGRVWVESEPCVGTTFYFTIPEKELRA